MPKVVSISLVLVGLLIVGAVLNAKLSSGASLFAPKSDQVVLSITNSQTSIGKSLQPETTQLGENINSDTTLASFVSLEQAKSPELAINPAPSPTVIPEESPSPKPKATVAPATPIPTPTAAPTITPKITEQSLSVPPGSLSGDKIFDLTNAHRQAIGLPELQKDQRSCELAASRAPEIMHEVQTGTMHVGLAARNLPYWDNENIAYYNSEEETVNWWIADTIHRKQLEGNFKYSCAACYKNACAQELTNFAPK